MVIFESLRTIHACNFGSFGVLHLFITITFSKVRFYYSSSKYNQTWISIDDSIHLLISSSHTSLLIL